ncbi:MAG: MATE family efflux transporter [Sphaerochaeta sp.]|jgi:putative MATE family efflux protein|nr:MATE family efflux transporter [Sphaerochaeta sp.]
MTKDLTEGRPMGLILSFLLPVWLGALFQQFYTVVDTIIVGKSLGVAALAAVGSTGSMNFMINGFCMGLCAGFTIPIAQRFGAKDYSLMRKYVSNTKQLCILFSIGMTVLTVLTCRPFLALLSTPDDIMDRATIYIRIIFLGIPLSILYNMVSGIIRALGDSKTPLYFLVFSSVLNIFLDLLFILVFHWDVAGAAYATILSQGVSGLACLWYMKRKYPVLNSTADEKKVRTALWKPLCANGVPMGLQYSITAIGSVILQASVNSLGSSAVAAVTAGSRISLFFCTPFDAMGTTMATFGGQNTGAGKFDRLRTGILDCSLVAALYSAAAFAVMYFWGGDLSMLFLSAGQDQIRDESHLFLIINSLFYFPLAWVNIYRFMIQGMGFGTFAILSGVFEMIARSVVALVFVPVWGFPAVCFASPVAWILADCFLVPAFHLCKRRLEGIVKTYKRLKLHDVHMKRQR